MESKLYSAKMKAVTKIPSGVFRYEIIVKAANDRQFSEIARAGALGMAGEAEYQDAIPKEAYGAMKLEIICLQVLDPYGRDRTAEYRSLFEYHERATI